MEEKITESKADRLRQNHRHSLLAVHIALAANVLLALLKGIGGILTGSPALLADGINSTSDVAYGVVVAIFIRLSSKPADEEHPYGHAQLESVAAVVIGAFIITTAIAIFWSTVNSIYEQLRTGEELVHTGAVAVWIALFAAAFKVGLSLWTYAISRKTQNAAVLALAKDHRNDIFAASAAAIGIFFGQRGLPWIDPLAGAVVALVILKTGVEILLSASSDLMDTLPGEQLNKDIATALQDLSSMLTIEEARAHRFGPYLVINLTLGMDANLSLVQGHRLATLAEERLLQQIPLLKQVYVHYHPFGEKNPDVQGEE